jgi:hypothetical protein
MKDAEVGVVGV